MVAPLEFEFASSALCCSTSCLLPPPSEEEEWARRSREALERGSVTSSMLRNPTDLCLWLQASTPLVKEEAAVTSATGAGRCSDENSASLSPSSCTSMPMSLSMQGQDVQGAGRKVAVTLYKGWGP